jgi:hypothetical protein
MMSTNTPVVDLGSEGLSVAGEEIAATVEHAAVGEAAIVGTEKATTTKKSKQKRHHWQFLIVDQVENSAQELVIDYPFLNDDNDQDYLFSKHLLIDAPYKAGHKAKGADAPAAGSKPKKGVAWKNFCSKMAKIKDRKGNLPFVYMVESTAKKRLSDYLSLCPKWEDKTGDNLPLEAAEVFPFLDDEKYPSLNREIECSRGEDGLNYSVKIRNNVLQIAEDHYNMNEAINESALEAQKKEAIEVVSVKIIKDHALGTIRAKQVRSQEFFMTDDSNINEANEVFSPSDKSHQLKKSLGSTKKKNPTDQEDFVNLLKAMEEDKKQSDAAKLEHMKNREKRKADQLAFNTRLFDRFEGFVTRFADKFLGDMQSKPTNNDNEENKNNGI